jgi:hypothetical protein
LRPRSKIRKLQVVQAEMSKAPYILAEDLDTDLKETVVQVTSHSPFMRNVSFIVGLLMALLAGHVYAFSAYSNDIKV